MTEAPSPFHILRSHASPLATLGFSPANNVLYAGDQDGFVSITDLRTRRVVSSWKAHEGGILGLYEWQGSLISQGRDNLIHVYERRPTIRGATLSSGPGPSRPSPTIAQSMSTNSLNFCRFSICSIPPDAWQKGKGKERIEGLMAVPNLVDSELIDIYHLPSLTRIHASINHAPKSKSTAGPASGTDGGRTGLVMSLHIAFVPKTDKLRLVAGFEDGRVEVWGCGEHGWETSWDARLSQSHGVWTKLFEAKGHNEAVMAMAVDRDLNRAFTVSADHLVVRYDLAVLHGEQPDLALVTPNAAKHGTKSFSTGQIGNASIAISPDGRVLAVGGWDGKIRLFSASSLKPLGVLAYHRETVHAITFANPSLPEGEASKEDEASTLEIGDEDDSDEEETDGRDGIPPRARWLASGGKDKRVAIWGLRDFTSGY